MCVSVELLDADEAVEVAGVVDLKKEAILLLPLTGTTGFLPPHFMSVCLPVGWGKVGTFLVVVRLGVFMQKGGTENHFQRGALFW